MGNEFDKEEVLKMLNKIRAIGDLMMAVDASEPAEFGVGVINTVGEELYETVMQLKKDLDL